MKTCSKCKRPQPVENFQRCKSHKDGKRVHCKDCLHDYYVRHKRHLKRLFVKRAYGKSLEELEEMKADIGNMCNICMRVCPLVVDHDHFTKKFRGLLCPECNKGLGHFMDNTRFLQYAIAYLVRTR